MANTIFEVDDCRKRRGTASPEVWQERVWHALRHLDDRSILNQSPLARLVYVQRLSERQFQGNILIRGLALREVLLDCVNRIIEAGKDERGLHKICYFLELVKEGMSLTTISKTLGLSREHVTRTYKKKAVELVTQVFISTIKNCH
jgi:hypothetical protein